MTVTKEQIQAVLARKDNVGMHAVGRALVHLLNRQTEQEQRQDRTIENNGVGFCGQDGEIGASTARFYKSRGYLTPKQVAYWQKVGRRGSSNIGKYWKQLLEEAEKKESLKIERRIEVYGPQYEEEVRKARIEAEEEIREERKAMMEDHY